METVKIDQNLTIGEYNCRVVNPSQTGWWCTCLGSVSNEQLFTQFGITRDDIYKVLGYEAGGSFPECETAEDLTKVIEFIQSKDPAKKPVITMEEIQKECIKRFPIGCKFTNPGCTTVKTLKEDHVTYEISGEHIYAHGLAGCLYDKGEYATLVSLPEEKTTSIPKFKVGDYVISNYSYLTLPNNRVSQVLEVSDTGRIKLKEGEFNPNEFRLATAQELSNEITSIPEYVECINALMFAKRGKIYPVVSDTMCMCEDGNTYYWKGSEFQPSTKEAYDAQFTKQEPIYAYVGDPLPKPLIDNVQSISVNLRTKKKTNKLKF